MNGDDVAAQQRSATPGVPDPRAAIPGAGPIADDGRAERPRGVDLAREALAAARTRSAAARAATGRRVGGGRAGTTATGQGAIRLRRRRWSGPGVDAARDPQPVGDVVSSWISKTGAGGQLAKASLFARWAEIVGSGIADHATPVSLVDGELTLQAESTAWATQLRLMARTITGRVNAEIGRGTVTRIRASGPAGPSWRFGNRHVAGRGPRDTYG